jgi:cysteinyl-tRNA synthetase
MTELRLHDTMAREKRVFTPADPDRVTIYVCGPTVYNRAHIGNARPAVVFDVLSRLLRHLYGEDKVVYARNVTDVDDKIIEAARSEGVAPEVITRRFEDFYLADMGALGVRPPDIAPHATHNIDAMIGMIARLIETGNAYEADGHVLFNVPSDPDYGALGRRDREAMIAGARVEVASYKKDPADFVLWKPSDESVIGWDSPWGRGRPGWHIECSAMIAAHLGDTIDIHGGGLDLIFPHHENEIAQSRCAHGGTPLAHYWVHNGFLSMAGSEKMSKSLGNVVTVAELLEQGHRGETLRLALLSAHYRKPLEWSSDLIRQTDADLEKFYHALEWEDLAEEKQVQADEADDQVISVLCEDIDTPRAIQRLHQLANECEDLSHSKWSKESRGEDVTAVRKALRNASARLLASGWLLGLDLSATKSRSFQKIRRGVVELRIPELMAARTEARRRRDFAEADRIRGYLEAGGIELKDNPDGTTDWRWA